ncbi:Uncharacterized protein TCM_037000 [Theobroma cacao]|uniref:Epidermal patterning factor-like protein n=1 Tax=Theobroma cacao TaxID=3641 RepID=A0A061GJY7_THECC|nr:Uncharacterized protein TCM_037000 [Theobroma cacao]
MAAPSSYYQNELKLAAILIFYVAFLPSESAALGFPSYKTGGVHEREKLQVGSRPPACLNKCSSCRPCMATLVIQPPQRKTYTTSRPDNHDIYYLLSWRCKCGNKLYRP